MKKFLRGVLVVIGIVFCVALAFVLHELDFWNWPVVKPTLGEYREHVVIPWREMLIGFIGSEVRSLKDGVALLFWLAFPWIGLLFGMLAALVLLFGMLAGLLWMLVGLLWVLVRLLPSACRK